MCTKQVYQFTVKGHLDYLQAVSIMNKNARKFINLGLCIMFYFSEVEKQNCMVLRQGSV